MAQQRYKLIENKQLTNSKIKKIKKNRSRAGFRDGVQKRGWGYARDLPRLKGWNIFVKRIFFPFVAYSPHCMMFW